MKTKDETNKYNREYYQKRKSEDPKFITKQRERKKMFARKYHEKMKNNEEYKKMKNENTKRWKDKIYQNIDSCVSGNQ